MRVVLQRVSRAEVRSGGEVSGRIGRGLLALVGIETGDGTSSVAAAARKIANLRVFEDGEGKMNLGPAEAAAAVLVVSQFTLVASLAKGRRPSFDRAALPAEAEALVASLIEHLRQHGLEVASGRFGTHMEVELVNDGPVTLVLEVDGEGRGGR